MKYSKRFEDALVFANQLHREQQRKVSFTPYVGHLLGVSSIVIEHAGNEDEAIAALLHDAIEDQGAEYREEIRNKFGDAVVEIVNGCTDSDTFPKLPWRERKEKYIAHLAEATPSILLVSASDKLQNSRAILEEYRILGDEVWERFKGKKDGTLWYYRALVIAFRDRISRIPNCNPQITRIVDELNRVVTELECL